MATEGVPGARNPGKFPDGCPFGARGGGKTGR
jgi:hypothetical protein